MPQTCRTCRNPERHAIERAILARTPYRDIAARYGLQPSSVHRHAADHLPEHLARALDAEAEASAADLLADLRELRAVTQEILQAAQEKHDPGTALRAVASERANLELLAKLRGLLEARHIHEPPANGTTEVHIVYGTDWRERDALLGSNVPTTGANGNGDGQDT